MNERAKGIFFGRWGVGLAMAAAAVLKAGLLLADVVPFNADEAIVALMARHILQGERPLFFYGQAYLGSLDAWLIAGGFAIFGQQVWVIRLVQILLYLGTIWTTALLGEAIFTRKVGVLAAWLLAIPAVNVTLYTTATLGGYGEALLLGNLILLMACIFNAGQIARPSYWLIFGLLVGFGLWVFGLTLVYSIPAGLILLWHLWRNRTGMSSVAKPVLAAGAGFLLGALPYWVGVAQVGGELIAAELSGSAIAGVEGGGWLSQAGQHLLSLLLLGTTVVFGVRPPWEVRWLVLPLLPFILIFWGWVMVRMVRETKPKGAWLLFGVVITLAAGFVFTPFGADPSGRYFLPLVVPLSLFAAVAVIGLGPRLRVGLVLLVLGYHLIGTMQVAGKNPPGLTTQFDAVTWLDKRYDDDLIVFLKEHSETRGYTNYWVAYPLAFLSGEELIFVPELPYHLDFRHTPRDNRYAPYNDVVAQADRVAYITTITTKPPLLDDRLRSGFTHLGVSWDEEQIGNYHVFYNLSRLVHPSELDLSLLSPLSP